MATLPGPQRIGPGPHSATNNSLDYLLRDDLNQWSLFRYSAIALMALCRHGRIPAGVATQSIALRNSCSSIVCDESVGRLVFGTP